MHSATTATGRPLPPPGKTLASASAALPPTAFSPVSNRNTTAFKNPRNLMKIKAASLSNRNTNSVSPHRPQLEGPGFAERAVCVPVGVAGHESQTTSHSLSNRHTPRLENAMSRRKQTLGASSNRHFLQVSASRQHQIPDAHHPPHNISNRQWQILENNVNLSKQTIAPRSNRHKNAVVKRPKSPITPATNSSHVAIRAWLAVPVVSDAESVYNLVYWLRDNVGTNQNSEDPAGVAGLPAIVRRRGFRIARASDANQ